MLCPLRTEAACSPAEEAGEVVPEIRAYKLGKKRWSYNQVELRLGEAGGSKPSRRAVVQQAVAASGSKLLPEAHQESAIAYQIQLASGRRLLALVYLCFDQQAAPPGAGEAARGGGGSGSGGGGGNVGTAAGSSSGGEGTAASGASGQARFTWRMVTRAECRKGCSGIVLRAIQRFGRLGKRAWNDEQQPSSPLSTGKAGAAGSMKDPKFMYLSLDEACTHVGAAAFRLVAGVYDSSGERLLATSVSPPIRVLANNDVPTGAARIPLDAHLPADWEGWAAEEAASGGGAAADGSGAGSEPLSPSHAGRTLQQLACQFADRAASSGSEESPPQQQQQPQQQAQQLQPGSPGGGQPSPSHLAELLQRQGGGGPGAAQLTSQLLQQAAAARGQLLQAAQQLVHLESLLQAVGVTPPGQISSAAEPALALAAAAVSAGQQQQQQQRQGQHSAGSAGSPSGSVQPTMTAAILSPFLGSVSLPPLSPRKRSGSHEGEQEGAAAVNTPLAPPPQPTQPSSVAPPERPPGEGAAAAEAERQLDQLLRLKALVQAATDMGEPRGSGSGKAAASVVARCGGGEAAAASTPGQPTSPAVQGTGAAAATFPAPVQKPSLLPIPELKLG